MFSACRTHSSSASATNCVTGVTLGLCGADIDVSSNGVTVKGSVGGGVAPVVDVVTVRPDLRRVRVARGKRRSDSDSSPDMTGELERDVVVAPLPRLPLRLPAKF